MASTCKICNQPTKRPKAIYCSNQCKFSDSQYNKSRQRKIVNDEGKVIKHIATGKIFKDIHNTSGILTKYCNKLQIPFNTQDWQVLDVKVRKKFKCPYCSWTTVDVEHNSGAFIKHAAKKHNKTKDEIKHEFPEINLDYSLKQHRDRFLQQNSDNRIQCKECGFYFKTLTQTHLALHDLTPQQYKDKYAVDKTTSNTTSQILSDLYSQNTNINKIKRRSNAEIHLQQVLEQAGVHVIPNDRSLGFELDLYIPELNLAVEYDGLFWHSELGGGKSKRYHLDKTERCESNNIHLIHIFEDEFLHNRSIVQSRVLNLVNSTNDKIGARQCKVVQLDVDQAKQFLNQNHLQGYGACSIRLGLMYKDQLVSCMTFAKPRRIGIDSSHDYELVRFANKLNTNVIGAASKLFKYFTTNNEYSSILSYADRRWTSTIRNSLYDTLQFKKISVTPPNYWYVMSDSTRSHRYNFTKHKILARFNQADANLSEWSNMVNLGYDRIWDCGSIKYVYYNY